MRMPTDLPRCREHPFTSTGKKVDPLLTSLQDDQGDRSELSESKGLLAWHEADQQNRRKQPSPCNFCECVRQQNACISVPCW